MTDRTVGANDRYSRLKIALIPILALVLIWVLFGPDDQQDSANPNPMSQSRGASLDTVKPHAVGNATTAGGSSAKAPQNRWPEIGLAETLLHDPFATLTARVDSAQTGSEADHNEQPETQRENDERRLAEGFLSSLRQSSVSILFESSEGKTAVIGSQVVREGDLLHDRFRVVEIRSDGVVLEVVRP